MTDCIVPGLSAVTMIITPTKAVRYQLTLGNSGSIIKSSRHAAALSLGRYERRYPQVKNEQDDEIIIFCMDIHPILVTYCWMSLQS